MTRRIAQGQPFVGPAGKLLDRALHQAGISRNDAYVTNVVKHFGFTRQGNRRRVTITVRVPPGGAVMVTGTVCPGSSLASTCASYANDSAGPPAAATRPHHVW